MQCLLTELTLSAMDIILPKSLGTKCKSVCDVTKKQQLVLGVMNSDG